MTTTVLRAARLIGAERNAWVAIDDDKVAETGSGDGPKGAVDLGDAILAPGFIDVQVNGIGDVDFSHCDSESYARAAGDLLRHGVTTFLPTLISAPLELMHRALDELAAAGVFGVHLEGPFLGGAPGAHRREVLRTADVDWMTEALERYPNLVRFVTLAPEADPDFALTKLLAAAGVVVALGHSMCSFAEACAGVEAGARAVTHLFNGMGPLHHREPGLAGAALEDDRLTPTLIADLVHVHPAALKLATSRKRNVALVSDSIGIDAPWAAERGVRALDGAPRLQDGTLAGSILTMDQAVRNMASIGVGFDRAIEMATAIPAELLGLDDRGTITAGKRADLVAVDPGDLSIRAVWHGGERVV